MAKWEKKAADIVEQEMKKHVAILGLRSELLELVHGFTPVDKHLLYKHVKNVCDKALPINSKITEIDMKPLYKESSESEQKFTVRIEGDFNGTIEIETSSGWRNEKSGRVDIFYVSSSKCKVHSDKEKQIEDMYGLYKDYAVENIIDLALENKYYLDYDDRFTDYEIWKRKPYQYGDSIKGSLRHWKNETKQYKRNYSNLSKLTHCGNFDEYLDQLKANYESITYKWTEYEL